MKSVRKKADKDLTKDTAELREKLRAFRFEVSGSKVRNMKEGRNLRKSIARHLTEMRARKGT